MIRVLNIFSCIVIIVLFTSYLSVNENVPYNNDYNTFQFTGSVNKEVKAEMQFKSSKEILKNGVIISTLNLELKNIEENLLSLVISNLDESISVGSYRISNNKPKTSTNFNEIFGYLNIVKSNDLPFYTEEGKIVITKIDANVVKGYLNLELENFNGESVLITGRFLANKCN